MPVQEDDAGKALAKEIYLNLKGALRDAFRSRDDLKEMLRAQLQVQLDVVSTASSLDVCIGDLIEWFTGRSTLTALVAAALTERPERTDLAAVRALVQRMEDTSVPVEEAQRRRLDALAVTLTRLEDQLEELRAEKADPVLLEATRGEVREIRRKLREGFQPLPVGLRIGDDGRYRLREIVQEGGAAWVYRAHDKRASSDVAIKVLKHPSDHSEEMRRRFQKGADMQLRLCRDEPTRTGIAEVYENGGDEEGYPFLVMRYYARGDLGRAMRDTPRGLTRFDALSVLVRIARTLASLHEQGVVHNDVKPSNILLNTDGSGQLTDFDLVETSDFTAALPGPRGTRGYAAPELLHAGRAGPLGDVYALGMTALFVLEGREPSNDPVWRRSPTLDHIDEQPEELRRVIERAIAFDANARYASMTAFADDLERVRGLVREVGAPTEVGLYELLLSVETTEDDRGRLWGVVGDVNRVTHPAAPWRSVALSLVRSAAERNGLVPLHRAIVTRWPDVELLDRERRVRSSDVRSSMKIVSSVGFWPLFRGLCELPAEQLEEVIWQMGADVSKEIGADVGGLEAILSLLRVTREREETLVTAFLRAGGRFRYDLPDPVDLGGEAGLMFAALRGYDLLPVSKGDSAQLELPSVHRRVDEEIHTRWAALRGEWARMPAAARRWTMRLFDMGFSLACRLAVWEPPVPVEDERRRRIVRALELVPSRVFEQTCEDCEVPPWATGAAADPQVRRAAAAAHYLSTWRGTIERVPAALARSFAHLLSGARGDVREVLVSIEAGGLTDAARSAARALLGTPRHRDEVRALTTIVRTVDALEGAEIVRFPALQKDDRRPEKLEGTALQRVVLDALPPLTFDTLVEDLDVCLGFLPAASVPQRSRAFELVKEAQAHGVWASFRDEVLRRFPERRGAYEALVLELNRGP